nr:hypothetical protein [Tanacetum cinerariifolium]
MSVLWDQLALTEPPELSSFDPYVKQRDSQQEVRLKSHDDMKIVGPSVFASMYRTMTSTSTKNRPHSKFVDVFGSTWFRMILPGYTSALHIADVFGCLVTHCRCVWLPGYTFGLQFADVFGSGSAM